MTIAGAVALGLCASASAQAPVRQLEPEIETCRVAAGFGPDFRFARRPEPHSIEVCRQALQARPNSTVASAFLGRALYSANRNAEALAAIQRSANADDPVGLALLGVVYEYGYGVERDLVQAQSLYERAAAAGHPTAQFKHALDLLQRRPERANVGQAKAILEKAASVSLPEAWRVQAWMLRRGIGASADEEGALSLYLRAAEAGDQVAAANAGQLLLAADPARARALLEQAAKEGVGAAKEVLGELLLRGLGGDVPASDRAERLLLQAEERNSPRAAWLLRHHPVAASPRMEEPAALERRSDLLSEFNRWLRSDDVEQMPWQPGTEATPWDELTRLLALLGSRSILFHSDARVSAAYQAHALLSALPVDLRTALLADAAHESMPRQVRLGAELASMALSPAPPEASWADGATDASRTRQPPTHQDLFAMLEDPAADEDDVRRTMSMSGTEELMAALRFAMTSTRAEVRRIALREIGNRKIDVLRQEVSMALGDREEDVRLAAVDAAADMRLPLPEDLLRRLLAEKSIRLRRAVLRVAGDAGWKLPEQELVAALRHADRDIARYAISAVGSAPSRLVRVELLSLLKGPHHTDVLRTLKQVRLGEEALDLLQEISQPGVLQNPKLSSSVLQAVDIDVVRGRLHELLRSPDTLTRRRAVLAAGRLGGLEFVGAIETALLDDQDPGVREFAADALKLLETSRSAPSLARALADQAPNVRLTALQALRVDRRTWREGALRLSQDSHPRVRQAAVQILSRFEDAAARGALTRLQQDPDLNVRTAAHARGAALDGAARAQWRNLEPTARAAGICQENEPDPAFFAGLAVALAADLGLEDSVRERALECAAWAFSGVDAGGLATIGQLVLDPTSSVPIRKAGLALLERIGSEDAARIRVAAQLRGALPAGTLRGTKGVLGNFPKLAALVAISPVIDHPSPLVRAHIRSMVDEEFGGRAALLGTMLASGNEVLRRYALGNLARHPSADTAPLLVRILQDPPEWAEQQLNELRRSLWSTRTASGHELAMAYASLRDSDLDDWASAVASRAEPASLARLITTLGRVTADRRRYSSLGEIAFELSSQLPDAAIDFRVLDRFANDLEQRVLRWSWSPQATFSPAAFRVACLTARDHPGAASDLEWLLWEEAVRVPPSHRSALQQSLDGCEQHWSARGASIPATLQAWMIRLRLDAGLPVPETPSVLPDRTPFAQAAWLLARAEVHWRAGRQTEATAALQAAAHTWIGRVQDHGQRARLEQRSALLRGLAAIAAGQDENAKRPIVEAVDSSGLSVTGIVAFALSLRSVSSEAPARARQFVEMFEERQPALPLAREAMTQILGYLVEHEVHEGRPQESLAAADALLAVELGRPREAPAAGHDDKGRALQQLRELERRVRTLAAARDQEAASAPDTELAQARQALKSWVTQLRARYPAALALLRPEPVSLAAIQEGLGTGRALVQYILLPRRAFAWVVTSERAQVVPIDSGEEEIRALVALARTQFTPGVRVRGARIASKAADSAASRTSPQEALRLLSQTLVQPVRAVASDRAHWVIVPHGSLHTLPFAALESEPGGQPLVAERTVSIAATAGALVAASSLTPDGGRELLAVGNPTPPDASWSPLPGAELEARQVADIYAPGAARVLLGGSAKRSVLLEQPLRGVSLHLALHGEAMPGDTSRLVLADGYLTLREIWALSLERSPRVVLSACETGLGEALSGNEVLSLANGFLFAGARSVVASLWRVPDEDTRMLMEDLYRQLATGHSTADALAMAQRQALARGRPAAAWAAFTVNGL
jgi:CHAT domain-containing protein/TPR repeat protein/HEAT repeat protein